MSEPKQLAYVMKDPLELNLAYIPFVTRGGLFIPTNESFSLGDDVVVNLQLPGQKDPLLIEGKVIWITPKNALHHVPPGIGIQFSEKTAQINGKKIEDYLDKSTEIGSYTYGM